MGERMAAFLSPLKPWTKIHQGYPGQGCFIQQQVAHRKPKFSACAHSSVWPRQPLQPLLIGKSDKIRQFPETGTIFEMTPLRGSIAREFAGESTGGFPRTRRSRVGCRAVSGKPKLGMGTKR
jgi:hypothetical protein